MKQDRPWFRTPCIPCVVITPVTSIVPSMQSGLMKGSAFAVLRKFVLNLKNRLVELARTMHPGGASLMNSGRTRMVLSLMTIWFAPVPKCWDTSGLSVIVFNNTPKLTNSFPKVVTDEYGSLLAITRGFSPWPT